MTSDEVNNSVVDAIASIMGMIYQLVAPLFSTVGFFVILYLLVRMIFSKKKIF